ncbi:hypothetical protein [Desulfovirgula thermocuniculi]|uniref:hypothetical protein n=1 Tax=Desulfovirgula thermocuniculi TaxID=348842 RepID=UPI0012EC1A95|nr:hypothetical protein [Desulfovirgula thermocuniculi]
MFKELVTKISQNLVTAPERAARLILERGEVSDQLHRALDAIKEREAQVAGEVAAARNGDGRPLYPNEQARQAEIHRRLQADGDYQALRQEADRLRQALREIDAQIEHVSRGHRSDVAAANLVASLLGAGLREEALAALQAYVQGLAGQEKPAEAQAETQPQEQAQADAQVRDADSALVEGTFEVLEARVNDRGVVRAWCEGPGGLKVALYAKNGAAKALETAVGKRVRARYRCLDHGFFAVEVRPVA